MIETTRQNYKTIAVVISTIGAGLPIWTRPPRDIDFTDLNFLGLWLLTGTIAAFISLFFINLKTKELMGAFTIGYVVAVVTMFIGGILIANYVHNQLTVALPIAMITGIVSGGIGSLIWSWIKKR